MAKITAYIPEPSPIYDPNQQQQVLQALDTLKNQLNFGYQEDLRQEVERVTWFMMSGGNC